LIRIIGIGSPFGDDAVGLEVARILAEAPPPGCEVIAADRPGATLIDLLDGADAAILVDAVRSGAKPGTVHELGFDELERCRAHFVSSHDLDVIPAIQLARKLGRAPVLGRVVGLEIARTASADRFEALSATARGSIDRIVAAVRSWAAKFDDRERVRLTVTGVVQGVGFRPFVWRLATAMKLVGFVRNVAVGVEIEIEGSRSRVRQFPERLRGELPVAAELENIEVVKIPVRDEREFRAMPSARGRAATTIPPDLAICDDCAREIQDPADRRFRYPFTNCTACGPRFTVVRSLPYDRAATTLSEFALCEQCEREYHDPSSRRFRAEPIACPACGPRAWLETTQSNAAPVDGDCIARAAALLRTGGIVAVQGIGGVHLACDATDEFAVARLREIKHRPHKPLAVMVDSLASARRLAIVSDEEAALLTTPSAPIVLLQKRAHCGLAPSVAPGNDHVGLMLAYSPLHQLVVRDAGRPLAMTSANRPGEPLARDTDEARAAFGDKVDALLLHNRPIHQRCDDGVWMSARRGPQPIRLSRGSTPHSLTVPIVAPVPILAAGGDIKNSFCLLSGSSALMSQYIGKLESTATQQHFRDSLEKWVAMGGIKPAVAVHDLHPQSFARAIVTELGLETIGVQHHHAHIAACLAEHGHDGPAIGIAFDGSGYGADGSIWGGEAMLADLRDFRRLSHLQSLPLAGGDAAVRHPSRIAAAFLIGLFGSTFSDRIRRLVGDEHARILTTMVDRGLNTFPTSSCGRLFDAVAALLGICPDATYEAQAAIELEAAARSSPEVNHIYPFSIRERVVQTGELIAAIVGDVEHRTSIAKIARAFHDTMAEIVASMALDARTKSGVDTVALSGGCFQNRLLLAASIERLERHGFTVLAHRRVPANDGGLALGQAVIAAARLQSQGSGGSSCVSEFQDA
jgi:hydrogenase maturation protein HypF